MTSIEAVVSDTLGIAPSDVRDELGYKTIAEWDSFAHVELMLALESAFGLAIDDATMTRLGSVGDIRAYVGLGRATTPTERRSSQTPAPDVRRGLAGVYVDESAISSIDPDRNRLEYRGYDIDDLALRASFEEVVGLLVDGRLPGRRELAALKDELGALQDVPDAVLSLVAGLTHLHPMRALRTAVSALETPAADIDERRAGLRLIAQVPTLIAAHAAARAGRSLVEPPAGLSHATRLLWLLSGEAPSANAVRFVERDLVVHADHDLNASTFVGRVVVGCGAGLHAAVTAALAAFEGPLHGGAAQGVMELIDDIGEPSRADAYVRDRRAAGEPIMGFGHRVYRGEDPRVRHLRSAAMELSAELGETTQFAVIEALVAAMADYSRHGIGPNVDLYGGLVYRLLGFPDDLATALFSAGRIAGWVVQCMEQRSNNVLIRPLLRYVGPHNRAYVPLDHR